MDVVGKFRDLGQVLTRTDRNLEHHFTFLQKLQWSLISFMSAFIITFGALHFLAIKYFLQRVRRRKRNNIAIRIDEGEGGGTNYLVTIMTSRKYLKATTATTTLHLIGQIFPGRIHDIGLCKSDQRYKMFAPHCREKIIVKEDINLDPIIGLVLKTNQQGVQPTWMCQEITVRNLETNDAWVFEVKEEIGFSKCLQTVPAFKVLKRSHAFSRRLRQEWRHGEHSIFGVYYWAPFSVFSTLQRVVVTTASHLMLMSFVMLSLCTVLPSQETAIDRSKELTPREKKLHGGYGVTRYGWSLEGESHMTIWFTYIIFSALLGGFITVLLSHVLIMHFRERGKYERGLSEMDYVVGTALRKCSADHRRESLLKLNKKPSMSNKSEANSEMDNLSNAEEKSKVFSLKKQPSVDSDATMLRKRYPPRDTIFEPNPIIPPMTTMIQELSPAEARAQQRFIFVGGSNLDDPLCSQIVQEQFDKMAANSENSKHHHHHHHHELVRKLSGRSGGETPAETKMKTYSERWRSRSQHHRHHRHKRNRLLRSYTTDEEWEDPDDDEFGGGVKQRPVIRYPVPEIQFPTYRGTGSAGSLASSDAYTTDAVIFDEDYIVKQQDQNQENEQVKWWTEDSELLPGEKDPANFKRSFFKPCFAWIILFGILTISLGGFFMLSSIGPHASIHPELFAMIFVTSFLIGLFIQTFFFEIVKMAIISLFYAYNDRKMYKKIIENGSMPRDIGFQYKS